MLEKIFGITRRRKLRKVLNILYSLEENSKQFTYIIHKMSSNGILIDSNIVKYDVNLIILCNLTNVLFRNIYWKNFDFINI